VHRRCSSACSSVYSCPTLKQGFVLRVGWGLANQRQAATQAAAARVRASRREGTTESKQQEWVHTRELRCSGRQAGNSQGRGVSCLWPVIWGYQYPGAHRCACYAGPGSRCRWPVCRTATWPRRRPCSAAIFVPLKPAQPGHSSQALGPVPRPTLSGRLLFILEQ